LNRCRCWFSYDTVDGGFMLRYPLRSSVFPRANSADLCWTHRGARRRAFHDRSVWSWGGIAISLKDVNVPPDASINRQENQNNNQNNNNASVKTVV